MTSGCINRPVPCSQLVRNMWNTLLCCVTVIANYFYRVPKVNEQHVSAFGLWALRNMSYMKRHCRRRVISQLLRFQTLNIRHEYRTVLYIAKSVFIHTANEEEHCRLINSELSVQCFLWFGGFVTRWLPSEMNHCIERLYALPSDSWIIWIMETQRRAATV